jgi:hypothetical protein
LDGDTFSLIYQERFLGYSHYGRIAFFNHAGNGKDFRENIEGKKTRGCDLPVIVRILVVFVAQMFDFMPSALEADLEADLTDLRSNKHLTP